MSFTSIKKSLLKRRAELVSEIADRDSEVAKVTIEDEEDKPFERLDDEVLSALSSADRDEVAQIDAALSKIEDGTYGICEQCGDTILTERLEAIPFATLCISCATEAEVKPAT